MTTTAIDTIASQQTFRITGPFDSPEDAAHIVMVPPGQDDETPQAYVLRAIIEGFPVTALCGYTWTPSKDPRDKPVCDSCLDIYQQPGDHRDERDDLPEA